jgi:hypothetical protein
MGTRSSKRPRAKRRTRNIHSDVADLLASSKRPRAKTRQQNIYAVIQDLMADEENRRHLGVVAKEMSFACALQKLIDMRNASYIELAAKMGVGTIAITDVLKLKRSPDLRMLIGFAEALDCALVLNLGGEAIDIDPNGVLKRRSEAKS